MKNTQYWNPATRYASGKKDLSKEWGERKRIVGQKMPSSGHFRNAVNNGNSERSPLLALHLWEAQEAGMEKRKEHRLSLKGFWKLHQSYSPLERFPPSCSLRASPSGW